MDKIRQVRLSSHSTGSVSGIPSVPVNKGPGIRVAAKPNVIDNQRVASTKSSHTSHVTSNTQKTNNTKSAQKSSHVVAKGTSQNQSQKLQAVVTKEKAKGKNAPKAKKSVRKKANKPVWPIYLVAGLAMALLVYTVLHFLYKPENTEQANVVVTESKTRQTEPVEELISDRIYFSDIALGGLSYQDFSDQLAKKSDSLLTNTELQLTNEKNDKKPKVTAKSLGYTFDAEKMYQNAEKLTDLINDKTKPQALDFLSRKAKAGILLTTQELQGLATQENDQLILLPIYKENKTVFEKTLADLETELSEDGTSSGDVTFNVETLQFEFPDFQKGYTLDKVKLGQSIREAFTKNTLDSKIALPFKDNEEGFDPEELAKDTGLLGTGYTPFVTYDPARDTNVNRVAELLTGKVVMPGEVFSYWEGIDPVTVENGFTEGYQIGSDGQPELVLAGGVCQGSSTLYNAVVRSDLEVVERNNHTVPSLYITQGLDAMVSSWSDFKFRNNSEYPVAIVGICVPTEYVQFEIYGKKLEEGVTIDMEAFYLSDDLPGAPKRVPTSELPEGEERTVTPAITGSFWSTDKVYFKDGVEFKREHLNNSHYWAYNAVIEYGTGTKKPTEPDPTETPTSVETTEPTT